MEILLRKLIVLVGGESFLTEASIRLRNIWRSWRELFIDRQLPCFSSQGNFDWLKNHDIAAKVQLSLCPSKSHTHSSTHAHTNTHTHAHTHTHTHTFYKCLTRCIITSIFPCSPEALFCSTSLSHPFSSLIHFLPLHDCPSSSITCLP